MQRRSVKLLQLCDLPAHDVDERHKFARISRPHGDDWRIFALPVRLK